MLRVRSLAAQGVRDFARRKIGRSSATVAAVRELTYNSSSSHSPATAFEQQGGESAAAAPTTAARAGTDPVQHGVEYASRAMVMDETGEHQEEEEEGGESPAQGDYEARTPEQELVSKLKRIRTVQGPGNLEQAMATLTKARNDGISDITAYNIVIKMIGMERWVSTAKSDVLEELLLKLEEDSLVPNIYTYNGIIFVYAQARSLPKVERAYREMVSKGLEPNVLTLSHLAMAQAWGSSNDMYRTLAEMDERGWTPTRAAHLSAISFMWQRKDTEGVLQMIQRMLEKSYQPTEAAFAIAIMSAGRLGRADLAKVLFEWRSASGLEPKREIHSSMMLAHSKADLHEESLAYWRQLVCLDGVGGLAIDLTTCRSALRSAIVSDQWDEVDTIVGMLRGKREATPDHTYKLAIAACRSRSGIDRPDYWQRVERTVEALRKLGVTPSPEVLCRVAVVYAQGKQWEKAAAMFEQTLAEGVEMWAFRWECMMQAFFFLERYDDVRKTWRRSKTKDGGQHTVRANELAMTTAHRLLDAEWAKEIMAVPENCNPKKGLNPATLLTAVKVLAETGKPREARQILQEWRPSKTTRINHKNFNELLLCCQQHGGTDVGLEFYRMLRGHAALSRLQPATFAFVVGALCEHGRAGEAAGVLEEQVAADYRPEKACYQAVASAALQSGDREASARFLEAAENAPPGTMAVNTAASDSGGEVVAFAGREGGMLDGDADGGGGGGGGGGDASLRQQRTPPVLPGAGGKEEGHPSSTAATPPATAAGPSVNRDTSV